jgi:hypothetical protein
LDRDSLRDVWIFVFVGRCSIVTPAVSSNQKGDARGNLLIDPVINDITVDGYLSLFGGQPPSDLLWRLTKTNVFLDSGSNKAVLESLPQIGLMLELELHPPMVLWEPQTVEVLPLLSELKMKAPLYKKGSMSRNFLGSARPSHDKRLSVSEIRASSAF